MDGKTVNLVLDYCLCDLSHIISDKTHLFKNVRSTPSNSPVSFLGSFINGFNVHLDISVKYALFAYL